MAIRTLSLPLFDESYYTYSVPLEGQTFVFDFLYIEKMKSWYISIKDSAGNSLLTNKRLTPNTEVILGYRLIGLSGFLYFTPKADVDPEYLNFDLSKPKSIYDLLYVYNDGT